MRTELPELFIESPYSVLSKNLRYYYGELRKRGGLETAKWNLGDPVQGIYNYRKFDASNYHLALTPNDLFELNDDGTAIIRTPLYTTGTIVIEAGTPTIVTGTGTLWQTAAIKVGHKLALSANQTSPTVTWYVVQSIDSETQITLTSSAVAYSGNYTIRKCFLGGTLYTFRAIIIGNYFVFLNGNTPVMVWNGSGQASVLHSTPFYFLTGFMNRLILGKSLVAGSEKPSYIQWSTIIDIADFSGTGSGAKYFWETGEFLTGLSKTGNSLAVYQSSNIFVGIPTGTAESPFQWQLRKVGQGLVAPYSLVEYSGLNIGVGKEDFFVFDGNNYLPVGREVIKQFLKLANYPAQIKTIGFADSFMNVHFIVDTNEGRLDFKCNMRDGKWSIDEFNSNITAGAILE